MDWHQSAPKPGAWAALCYYSFIETGKGSTGGSMVSFWNLLGQYSRVQNFLILEKSPQDASSIMLDLSFYSSLDLGSVGPGGLYR